MKVFCNIPCEFQWNSTIYLARGFWSCVYKYTYIMNIQKTRKYTLHHFAPFHGQSLIIEQVLFKPPYLYSFRCFLTFSCNEVNHSEIKLSKIYSGSLFFIIGVIFCVAISYVISFNCYTLNLISCWSSYSFTRFILTIIIF